MRNRDETATGVIKGSLPGPFEEIVDPMSEIPKDKRIVTHCLTGVRGKMVDPKLKDHGQDVGFLNAVIEFAADRSFRITPP